MRKPTILVAGAAIALLLAGCGDGGNSNNVASLSSPNPTSSAAPPPGGGNSGKGDDLDQEREYASCMRQHGYDMKDPGPGEVAGINPNDPKFGPAAEACKSLEPTSSENPDDPAVLDKERRYASCMRQHGVDIPDPKPGEGMQLPNGDDPHFPAAIKACQSIMG